jgi:hypothetical protein
MWIPSMEGPPRESNLGGCAQNWLAAKPTKPNQSRRRRGGLHPGRDLSARFVAALGRPPGSAGVAVEADQRRRSWHGHGSVAIVAIAQIDRHDSATPAIWAAPIAMQCAGAAQQGFTAGRQLELRKRNKSIRRRQLGWRRSARTYAAAREGKDHSVALWSDDTKTRTRRRARRCGEAAHP